MTDDNIVRKGGNGKDRTQFGEHERRDGNIDPLVAESKYASMEPKDIDKELAVYAGDSYALRVKVWAEQDWLYLAEQFQEHPERFRYDSWKYRDLETRIPAAQARVEALEAELDEIYDTLIRPIDEEFERRGGWTRFFLVTSSDGGHVHRNRYCHTCNERTQYVWLTEESGKSEEQIVEKAGDGACTACFPTAPVRDRNNPRPNPYEDPKVTEAREQRAAEKATRDAAKAAKGITNPDGSTLRDSSGSEMKTERAAEVEALRNIGDAGWYDAHPYEEQWLDFAARAQVAIAAKRGVDVSVVAETWVKKLSDKAKRDSMNYQQVERAKKALARVNALVKSWDSQA